MSSHVDGKIAEGERRVLPAQRCAGPECRRHFSPSRRDARYCSTACRIRACRRRAKEQTERAGTMSERFEPRGSEPPVSMETGGGSELSGMFVPVVVREPSDSVGPAPAKVHGPGVRAIELVLSDRCQLRIPDGFEAATLRKLLAVLQEEGLC